MVTGLTDKDYKPPSVVSSGTELEGVGESASFVFRVVVSWLQRYTISKIEKIMIFV